ncbi:PTS system mannose-specific transporter subunit IID [Listeria fleischmannii subsp. coloradonensis]|nr:PTS system mannose-specific transporter subunit IID [Listeria fleischmannii subsp. coloradonensis]
MIRKGDKNMATEQVTIGEKKLTKRDLMGVFIRSNLFQGSWNFERMQSLGFCFSVIPVIKRLYPEKGPERELAIKRHLEFFNTHPYMAAPILGVTSAMEEQKANGADIDESAINGIKVGLMGPLAGVGDPIFWGTVRPVLAALGAGFATDGSIIGPLLFFVLFNAIRLGFRYWGVVYGYTKGTDVVSDMSGGVLQKLTEGASILGLFVMGALVNKWTTIYVPLVAYTTTDDNGKKVDTTVQSILDQLMPGLLALGLTFLCMWILKKKVNPLWLILGLFVVGIVGYATHILGIPPAGRYRRVCYSYSRYTAS